MTTYAHLWSSLQSVNYFLCIYLYTILIDFHDPRGDASAFKTWDLNLLPRLPHLATEGEAHSVDTVLSNVSAFF